MKKYIIIAVSLFFVATSAFAANVTVKWNSHPNPDGDLAGFKIYYGTTSKTGTTPCVNAGYNGTGSPVTVSSPTATSQVVSGLLGNTKYYFAVSAYDVSTNESACSIEQSTTTPTSTDTIPPTVSMTAPSNGATVSGSSVPVSATASDSGGMAGVQFKVDGTNIGSEDTSTPYSISWNSTTVSNGTHTLYAVARDTSNNYATSSVSVTVNNTGDVTPPTVSMTAPSNGATVSGSSVPVSATASDSGGMAGVQFKVDGTNIGSEDINSPYSISWNSTTVTNGSHSLVAVARDVAGNRATSTVVSVTVNNVTTTPIDVTISASPNSGSAPLNNVSLTANVTGTATGNINYTFYCNRSDTGTNITTGYDVKYDNQTATSKTASSLCNYSSAGTYTAKIIVERGLVQDEARATVTVTVPPGPVCGDGSCNTSTGESCSSCPTDCGGCPGGPGGPGGPSGPTVNAQNFTLTKEDGNLILENNTVPNTVVVFKAKVSSSDAKKARLEIELRNSTENFTGTPTIASDYVDSGSFTSVKRGGLANGTYKFKIRARNIDGYTSEWLWYGNQNTPDFVVNTSYVPPPSSFKYTFKVSLSLGMKHADVTALQKILNLEGVYPENNQSGYFGNLTRAAVIKFQQKYKISPAIGYIGSLTRAKLNELYGGGTPPPTSSLVGPFSIGMRSAQVTVLQKILAKDKVIYPEGLATGFYGPATEKAVQRFQCKYMSICSGSSAANGYGLAGPGTRKKIIEILGQ